MDTIISVTRSFVRFTTKWFVIILIAALLVGGVVGSFITFIAN